MKKTALFIALVISISSCESPEQKELKKKLEDQTCKAEFNMWLIDNSIQTQILLKDMGYEKELEEFRLLKNDTLISCDSLKNAWSALSDKTMTDN
ncbi:MAG: hypothetical protein ACK5W1_01770 [Flavobacteriales bacterium]|jgi:hypothetical protein